jgi:phosphate-selective porin
MKSIMTVALAAAISTPVLAKTAPITVGDSAKLAISGFVQADYIAPTGVNVIGADLNGNGIPDTTAGLSGAAVGTNDTFGINRLILSVAGQPADKITAKVNFAYGDSAMGVVQDAFVDLSYINNLTIRAGQFALPIGTELDANPYSAAFVNNSLLATVFAKRNRGIMAYGNLMDNVSYDLGIANGGGGALNGVTGNESNSDAKQFFGRLTVEPAKDLSIALYGDFYKFQPVNSVKEVKSDVIGLDASYAIAGFGFGAGYASGKVTQSAALNQKITDLVGSVTYKIPETDLQLAARYEENKTDSKLPLVGEIKSKVFTAGINWDFDKNARVQLQREFWSSDVTGMNKNDMTVLQLGVSF